MSRLHYVCLPNTKVAGFSKLSEFPAECVYPKFPQCINECFLVAFRMCSVWFPNDFRILPILTYFPNAFRTRRINLECTELFPSMFGLNEIILITFGKHSSCSKSIRGVRKAYRTQHLHSECTKN
jgi:hypothetical protein